VSTNESSLPRVTSQTGHDHRAARIGLLVALTALGAGCDSSGAASMSQALPDAAVATDDGDAAPPAPVDAAAPPEVVVDAAAGDEDAGVVGITVSPLTLTPSFSQTIQDYTVRCAAGDNTFTLTVTDGTGTQSISEDLVPDQELNVRNQYWIRCLPPDFPAFTVSRPPDAGAPTPGWYLINNGTYGIALDTNGTPVWYTRGTAVANVDAPAPDTLSFMPNQTAGSFGFDPTSQFEVHALDSSTTTIVNAVGDPTDVHELRVLPNGDHLLYAYPIETNVDLTGLQMYGDDESMADCEVQEVDPSGRLVWSWLASQHIDPVRESLEPAIQAVNGVSVVDPFHFNSIEVDGSGNLLLSSRHTNALFYVDRTTGTIQWKLGGVSYNKDGATYIQVVDDPETTFSMQHDARFLPNGDVSLFDDHGAGTGVARGVEYTIDHEANTAAVAFQFLGIAQSSREGSFRRYADGHSVIGWGYIATDPRVVTEIDENGKDILDIAMTGKESYRAVKVPISQLDVQVLRSATAK
jgi:Arylsulfotransferase (ASST)